MPREDSIISIIQKMVQDGEPREKIVRTLADLGVSEEQSKRLLLIAEADTFTVLKKEIGAVVRDEVDKQKKDLENYVVMQAKNLEVNEKKRVDDVARSQLSDVERSIVQKLREFESRVSDVISATDNRSKVVKMSLDSISTKVSKLEMDVEEIKVHKYRKSSMFFSYFMLGLGAVTLIIGLAVLFLNFAALDSVQILIIAVLFLASLGFMFASIVS